MQSRELKEPLKPVLGILLSCGPEQLLFILLSHRNVNSIGKGEKKNKKRERKDSSTYCCRLTEVL